MSRSTLVVAIIIFNVMIMAGRSDNAHATTIRIVNLQNLIEQSQRIFVGKCLSFTYGRNGNIPYTSYTFQVIDHFKGITTETVSFQQFGAQPPFQSSNGIALGPIIAGMPRYYPDQTYLLFAGKEGSLGLSSPVGLGQGAFTLQQSERGKEWVNAVNNQNLTKGLMTGWLNAKGLTKYEIEQLDNLKKGPIGHDFFIEIIKKMSKPGDKRMMTPAQMGTLIHNDESVEDGQ